VRSLCGGINALASAGDRQRRRRTRRPRATWLERTNAHEIRLGLTRRQRATLRGALRGQRSLWSFSAAELYAMIEQLERLSDVAAVQAFLETDAGDTGLSAAEWQ
jgi:hypothetical protein